MNKYKSAFTLTETLIVLAIVGVVASLTLPSLNNYVYEASIGPSVGRCVQVFEIGMSTLFAAAQRIASENGINIHNSITSLQVKDVVTTSSSGLNAEAYLADDQNLYLAAQDIFELKILEDEEKTNYINKPKNYDGSEVLFANAGDYSVCRIGKTKGFFITEKISNVNTELPTDRVIERVYIDGNGLEEPNKLGHDIFLFGLTNSGKLVPAGSQAYNDNNYSETINLYTDDCSNMTVKDARSCAARLVTDGWKIKYR